MKQSGVPGHIVDRATGTTWQTAGPGGKIVLKSKGFTSIPDGAPGSTKLALPYPRTFIIVNVSGWAPGLLAAQQIAAIVSDTPMLSPVPGFSCAVYDSDSVSGHAITLSPSDLSTLVTDGDGCRYILLEGDSYLARATLPRARSVSGCSDNRTCHSGERRGAVRCLSV